LYAEASQILKQISNWKQTLHGGLRLVTTNWYW